MGISRARAGVARWLAVVTVALLCATPVRAAENPADSVLPTAAAALVPGVHLVGKGTLTFFGLRIYDGHYFAAAKAYSVGEPFALLLTYHRKLHGDAIATRSSEEIERLGVGSIDDRAGWDKAMRGLFPDVHAGDQITGVNLPGTGVQFFRNGKSLGTVTDPSFGRAFFGIWFDPKTSRPELRAHLLGG